MHSKLTCLFSMFAVASCTLPAQDAICSMDKVSDLYSDTWVGTDALGRPMPTADSVGVPKSKRDHRRVVGIFYITWHTQNHTEDLSPYEADVSKVLQKDSSARRDAHNPNWKYGSYHWGEPEAGYFLSSDEWVIRRDISMLQDAGVDVLVLDVTNGILYWEEWEILFSTMMKMRREGNMTPQILFWCYNNSVVSVVQALYEGFYKKRLYPDLWFYWDGKPLLLYNSRPEVDANGSGYDTGDYSEEVKGFFTLRNMWWGYYEWAGQRYAGTEDNWSFGYSMADERLKNMSPQELASTHKGKIEEFAVTPSQHPVSMTDIPMGVGKSWSRSYGEPALNGYDLPDSAFVPWLGKKVAHPEAYGIYFQERWEDALEADPQFLYINDWNEWTAGKYNRDVLWLGRENPFMFVDQYNAEFNRTIQPMKGGYTDNYYMQMVQNIRRYKGVRVLPLNKGIKEMCVDGKFRDWKRVKTEYRDTRGDVTHRDADGYGGLHYCDSSGRNDIVISKVAVGEKEIFFYVETLSPITSPVDEGWMLLMIDTDLDPATGWYGYDILLNQGVLDESTTSVLSYNEGEWKVAGVASYACRGRQLEMAVPKSLVATEDAEIRFDFKWADNPGELTDPLVFGQHGDSAPNRRFNYRFVWKKN